MAKLLFVHGTSVRKEGFDNTLDKIKKNINKYGVPNVDDVQGCLWGDAFGAKLNFRGISIPDYSQEAQFDEHEEIQIELWKQLYSDPLFEIRILGITSDEVQYAPPGGKTLGQDLDSYLTRMEISSELKDLIDFGEISEIFKESKDNIRSSIPYDEMLKIVSDPMGIYQMAVARAIIAESIRIIKESGIESDLISDPKLREQVVKLVRSYLGPEQAGVREWLVRKVLKEGTKRVTNYIIDRKQSVMGYASLAAGDILLYQNRGQNIRDIIHSRIREVANEPIIILAHSLGGVACVDLLIQNDLHNLVSKLITVGCQAPFFFEIDALNSLKIEENKNLEDYLPSHFPEWLNIYDLKDFLSFKGADIFPGNVEDVCVNNKQHFPESHSAYWSNEDFYKSIGEFIK